MSVSFVVNIAFVKLRCGDFLRGDTETEVKQKSVAEKAPQHDPQAVLRLAEMTDEPAGDKDTLHQTDKHGKIVGNGVFEKGDLHKLSALSIIKLK